MDSLMSTDWKDGFITNDPEDPETVLELKSRLVEMISEGKESKTELLEACDYGDHLIEECLEELVDEGALEVKER
jgi:hypothetical protein